MTWLLQTAWLQSDCSYCTVQKLAGEWKSDTAGVCSIQDCLKMCMYNYCIFVVFFFNVISKYMHAEQRLWRFNTNTVFICRLEEFRDNNENEGRVKKRSENIHLRGFVGAVRKLVSSFSSTDAIGSVTALCLLLMAQSSCLSCTELAFLGYGTDKMSSWQQTRISMDTLLSILCSL